MSVIKTGDATAFRRYNTKPQDAVKMTWMILAKLPMYLEDRYSKETSQFRKRSSRKA